MKYYSKQEQCLKSKASRCNPAKVMCNYRQATESDDNQQKIRHAIIMILTANTSQQSLASIAALVDRYDITTSVSGNKILGSSILQLNTKPLMRR